VIALCNALSTKGSDVVIALQLLAVVAALALGFVLGRIWELRREIQRDLSLQVRDLSFAAPIGEVLRIIRLRVRALINDRSKTGRSEQARVEPVMATAEGEPRELVALMNAIRGFTERTAA
jgi:hypothetical protein